MTFTTTNLVNDQVLVADGKKSEVLDGSQWAALKARQAHGQAHETFDAAVEAFFAPITEAAEALEATSFTEVDPITVVVLDEGEVGTPSRHAVVEQLTRDSIILRLIEEGETKRLVWVGDRIEIAAA